MQQKTLHRFQHDTKITKLTPFIAFYSTTIDQCQNIIVMSFHTDYNNNRSGHTQPATHVLTFDVMVNIDIEPNIKSKSEYHHLLCGWNGFI